MEKEFRCKGKRLANYLMEYGSKLIRCERDENGDMVFVFENDRTIDCGLNHWEVMKKRSMF